MKKLAIDYVESQLGQLVIVADGDRLCALEFADCTERMMGYLHDRFGQVSLNHVSNPNGFSDTIYRYFAGEFNSLNSIPVSTGGTDFQQQVWSALRHIPVGQTMTYQDIAIAIDRPTACRAVGMTNARNPIALVIPCHRVIGANGQLTGYAGGLIRKRWLLQHEGALSIPVQGELALAEAVAQPLHH